MNSNREVSKGFSGELIVKFDAVVSPDQPAVLGTVSLQIEVAKLDVVWYMLG